MSNTGRVIAKSLSNSNGKVKLVRGKVKRNIDPLIEWIKWLSYESNSEKARSQNLSHKSIEQLSKEELIWISEYKSRKHMLDLFKRYTKGECSSSEYMEVYDYMGKPIEDLMLDKLNEKELEEARAKITRLSKFSLEELNKKVKEEQQPRNYDELSMVDAYVLHVVSDFVYKKNIKLDNIKIGAELDRNAVMREKSMIYALKKYANK